MIAVELRGARVPVVGWFAHHYFFVICEATQRERWEVWQHAERCACSAGHVHRDLLPWRAGVGFGRSFLVRRWEGQRAIVLADRLRGSLSRYPERGRYRFWPGPNSNSYAQWVLGSEYRLPWSAFGARFSVANR